MRATDTYATAAESPAGAAACRADGRCARRGGRAVRICAIFFAIALAACAAIACAAGIPLSAFAAGTSFTAEIVCTAPDGSTSRVSCSFKTTGSDTCEVAGTGKKAGAKAVDARTAGVLTIPETVSDGASSYRVTSVGAYAFGDETAANACGALTSVELPDTVTSIGQRAFSYCTALERVDLPASLKTVSSRAFFKCAALCGSEDEGGTLDVPASVVSIEGYAFCNCNAIRTVVFEGDAPTMAKYAFTGGEMRVDKVVYRGSALKDLTERFNGEQYGDPLQYYPVSFYKDEASMRAGDPAGLLGVASVCGETEFSQLLFSGRIGDDTLYESSIPAYPEGTNVWNFFTCGSGVSSEPEAYCSTVRTTTRAYCSFSDYRDLGTAVFRSHDVSYSGLPLSKSDYPVLSDKLGTELGEADVSISYLRRNADGSWAAAEDISSPGVLRAVAVPASGSMYTGSASVEFEIKLEVGSCFGAYLTLKDAAGKDTQVLTWFTVRTLDGESGTVAVSCGNVRYTHENELGVDELDYPHAVPVDFDGVFVVPDTVRVGTASFAVTEIAESAFGRFEDSEDKTSTCQLTGVRLSAGLEKVGNNAFRQCMMLKSVEFAADADDIAFGDNVFRNDTSLVQVIYRGKKTSNPMLFGPEEPACTGEIDYYYTVTYYESKKAQEEGADPLGTACLRDDVVVALANEATAEVGTLYDGAVPNFPDSLIDDGRWYAPWWRYPEVNEDNGKALRSYLTDSCSAYASQTNDAYTVDNAFTVGFDDGAEYDYTGSAVINPDYLCVVSYIGRHLVQGTDYTVRFEREDPELEGSWIATDDLVNAGTVRLVVEGAGSYSGSIELSFTVIPHDLTVGDVFVHDIPVVQADGSVEQVPCTMRITAAGDAPTAAVGTIGTCIDPATAGSLTLPASVEYQGNIVALTSVSNGAFSGTQLTAVQVPATVESLGSNVFSDCTALASARLECSASRAVGLFNGCTSLASVSLAENETAIASAMFAGCSSLASIYLPEGMESIGSSAFNGCIRLTELELPVSMQTLDSDALAGSSVHTLAFREGTVEIGQAAFSGLKTVRTLVFPATLASIGKQGFSGCGITELTLPSSIGKVDELAFGYCTDLTRVNFEGPANEMDIATSAFTQSLALDTVVYRDAGLDAATTSLLFRKSSPDEYYTITYWKSGDDLQGGVPCGSAVVLRGSSLREVNAGTLASDAVLEGALCALPAESTVWRCADGTALSSEVRDSLDLYAVSADVTDLSNGWMLLPSGVRYTGDPLDPLSIGSGRVVDPQGAYLETGTQFTYGFERRDETGAWRESADISSLGLVRITATAVAGSGYTGSVSGSYCITAYLEGDIIVSPTVEGTQVEYVVTAVPDESGLGEVAVGRGSRDYPAVQTGGAGVLDALAGAVSLSGGSELADTLTIPDTVPGESGFAYAPTSISNYAFYRVPELAKVRIPATVTRIGVLAFGFEKKKLDTQVSNLETVEFMNDMSVTRVADNAFEGCDAVKTVMYGGKKGSFDAFGASTGIVRYYTCTYYASKDEVGTGEPRGTVVAREGEYAGSISPASLYPGSGSEPAADEGMMWTFVRDGLDAEGALADSVDAYQVAANRDLFYASVDVRYSNGSTGQLTCSFTKLRDENDELTGTAALGSLEDGAHAVALTSPGCVIVPAAVTDAEGTVFDVTEVGAFAFGSGAAVEASSNITGIVLPASVVSIGQAAFANCSAFSTLSFDGQPGLEKIGASAFEGCASLKSAELPSSLAAIGGSAFKGSGLVRIYLPYSLESLGKSAFAGCTALREAVFGGTCALSLAAPEGADGAWKDAIAAADDAAAAADARSRWFDLRSEETVVDNGTRLGKIDDYCFDGCTALSRVVFDADMGDTVLSAHAFDGCGAIDAVVYGGGRLQSSVAFGSSKPEEYLTVSYFRTSEDRRLMQREAAVSVRDKCVYASRTAADAYAGEEPAIDEHWQWAFDFDAAEELMDSGAAVGERIRYAIDASGIDAAISCAITVNGSDAQTAVFGDTVGIALSTDTSVDITGFMVENAEDGTQVAAFEGANGAFAMPTAPVRVTAYYVLPLTVGVDDLKGGSWELGEISLAEMEALAGASMSAHSAGAAVDYTHWSEYRKATYLHVESYVEIDDLLASVGGSFVQGDSLVLYSGDECVGTMSYTSARMNVRSVYPGFQNGSEEGATEAPLALAIRSSQYTAAQQKAGTVPESSLAHAYRLVYGQRAGDMTQRRDTLSGCYEQITQLRILKGAESVESCTVSDLADSYEWTGSDICPVPTLTDEHGRVLEEGVDFELEYADNEEAGIATVTVTGIGAYRDSRELSFRIVRNVDVAEGSGTANSAAALALRAYAARDAGGLIVCGTGDDAGQLAAASLSGATGYPLMVVRADVLTAEEEDAVLQAAAVPGESQIIVVGNVGAVSEDVEKRIGVLAGEGTQVSRIGSATISAPMLSYLAYQMGASFGTGWSDTLVVANPSSFAEAATVSAYCTATASPLFLVTEDAMDDLLLSEITSAKFSRCVIAGGTDAVGTGVETAVAARLGADRITRLAGSDDCAASCAIAQWELAQEGMDDIAFCLASTDEWAHDDCMSALTVLAARNGILVLQDGVSEEPAAILDAHRNRVCLTVRFETPEPDPYDLSMGSIAAIAVQSYTGAAVEPALSVTGYDGSKLVSGRDYYTVYENNTGVGTGHVSAVGMGSYHGKLEASFTIAEGSEPSSTQWKRLAGADRYGTMQAVADEAFPQGTTCDAVVLASAENYPDALAATALAGVLGCPVVTSASTALSAEAARCIERLEPETVYVLGGTAALSESVRAGVRALSCAPEITELYGEDRIATSQAVYGAFADGWGDTAILATAGGFADALSIGGFAYAKKSPIFLVSGDGLRADQAEALRGFDRIVIVGGTAAVSEGIRAQAKEIAGADAVVELAGSDRLATSRAIAEFSLDNGMTAAGASVANAANFPDALAGGPLAGTRNSFILLVDGSEASARNMAELVGGAAGDLGTCYILGGTGAVGTDVENTLKSL